MFQVARTMFGARRVTESVTVQSRTPVTGPWAASAMLTGVRILQLRAESKLNRTVLVNKRHIFENMMVRVCCGLEHLATRRLVHRDIAARNILICGKGTAKIADFGLARDMYAVGYHRQDRGHDLLPLKWMAPEGLKNEARFTHKSDVWSFGVLMWEVAQLGRTPYPGMEGADRIYDAKPLQTPQASAMYRGKIPADAEVLEV
ncbi:fibroblast growth factor receptor 1-like [Branchiostoma floridae x Branchiostoma belcheri]